MWSPDGWLIPSVSGSFAFILTALVIPTIAQSNKGEIKGTVKDQNGAIVQNAQVTVVNSGTAAIHLGFLAAGLGPGDLMLTSPITFPATTEAAIHMAWFPWVVVCFVLLGGD